MALGSFPVKSQSMTHFREVEMWTLILEHQQGNHPPPPETKPQEGSQMLPASVIRN